MKRYRSFVMRMWERHEVWIFYYKSASSVYGSTVTDLRMKSNTMRGISNLRWLLSQKRLQSIARCCDRLFIGWSTWRCEVWSSQRTLFWLQTNHRRPVNKLGPTRPDSIMSLIKSNCLFQSFLKYISFKLIYPWKVSPYTVNFNKFVEEVMNVFEKITRKT